MSDYIVIVDDNENDSNGAPSQLKPRRPRKSTAGERKIMHLWTDNEIYRLIACVEQQRRLWDFDFPEYKLKKLDGWRIVVNELGIDGVDITEAKVKWSSLRTTYMGNLSKLRRSKQVGESHTVTWKFFEAMMFLEDNNNAQHSTSPLPLESDAINHSMVEEFSLPSPPSAFEYVVGNQRKRSRSITPTPSPPSAFEYAVGNQCKRSRSITPTTFPSPSPSPTPSAGSFNSQAISVVNSAVASLHSCDTNSTFCDNLLAELRTLSDTKARTLRYKISRLMMDFMEASQ
ncbi:uncharacterized protein LOC135958026 [Calliphora vicina]|uniref:uncharacterized protein LOC135958026 n=1 Tax=Calliphora vicina TaxID=7373 RepID=UPI00325B7662